MEYPKNGSVVIVDDRVEDVEDLIVTLSKQNVPVFYFTGKHEKLHRNLDNIKIMFLDINYGPSGVNNTTEVVDNLLGIITRLIGEHSKDYIVITWSTVTMSYDDELKKRLQRLYDMKDKLSEHPEKILFRMPKHVFSINKIEVQTDGLFDAEKIKNKINSIVSRNDILHLTTHWENNVLQSAKNVLLNFDNIAPTDKEQKKIYALFADSLSQRKHLNAKNIINQALAPISTLLSDQLSLNNSTSELLDIGKELVSLLKHSPEVNVNTVSKINTFYHVNSEKSCNNSPGTIYNYNDFLKGSCSSNTCKTMWAEGLEDKVKSKITSELTSDYFKNIFDENYKELRAELLVLNKERSYKWNIETIFNQECNEDICKKIKAVYSDFNTENEKELMSGLKKYTQILNKKIQEKIIKKQVMLVFKTNIDDTIKSTLSPKKDFNDLQFDARIKLLKDYYYKNEINKIKEPFEKETIPVFLEFSPDCDFVQGKRKKLRLVFGLLYPYDIYTAGQKVFNGDYYVYTPIIEHENKPYRIVFDLHTVTGINENILQDNINILFRLRKELLVDIQQKIATHIARPGFFNMNDYLK